MLASLYPDCKLIKENLFLTTEQAKKIKNKFEGSFSKLILRFKNECNGNYIYVDSHIVRTLNETIVLEMEKEKVKTLEIASFMEPKEYLPPRKWLDQFYQDKKIDSLSGATLSQNAIKRTIEKYKIVSKVVREQNESKREKSL